MSSLAFSGNDLPLRRSAGRRLALVPVLASPAVAVSPQAAAAGRDELPTGKTRLLPVALGVVLAHTALALWLHRPGAPEVLTPPTVPPISVELASALPPPPLPQEKKLPPPPPVQKREPVPEPQPVSEPVKAEPPPAPVAAAPAVTPAPAAAPVEKISEPLAYADYLHNPPPVYPRFAQDQGWEGRVLLSVHVSAAGRAESVELKKGSGRKLLDEAAIRAVQRWNFVPAKRGQTPVDGWVDVPVDFRLSN